MPEDALTATSRFYVAISGAGVALGLVLTVGALSGEPDVDSVLIGLGFAVGWVVISGWFLVHSVYRIDLRTDGNLLLHYVWGKRSASPSSISQIKYVKNPQTGDTYIVTLEHSKFRVTANLSTGQMMKTLMRLNPNVSLAGNGWDPTRHRRKPR